MAAELSNPESLDVLTSMLNQTLIETGRFFRSGGSLQSRAQLKRSIPAAHEQFQCALDNLSEQIFIAKAFLERDYEAVKARKAALCPEEDVAMGELNVKEGLETAPTSEQTAAATGVSENDSKPIIDAATVKAQPGEDTGQLQQPFPDHAVKEEMTEETSTAPPAQPLSGTQELNFDSMLNNSGGANEFDLNLDFGDDNDTGNENFLSGANFGITNNDMSFEGDNQQPGDTNAQSHTNNLPTGGVAFDLELQRAEALNPDGHLDSTLGGNMEDVMAPGESSFDDLFMENDNMGGDGVGDSGLLDGDKLLEFDDSWFN